MTQPYATTEDVARKLDLAPGDLLPDDREDILARLEAASQEWDRATGSPMRPVRVGAPGRPRTYETHDARYLGARPPVVVTLDHDNIVPINPDEGDAIEVRTGRGVADYEDVTDREGDEWVIDYQRGQLKLFRYLVPRIVFEDPRERVIRLTYRHGALGGGRGRGGRTTLASAAEPGDTEIDVTDTGGLPGGAALVTIGTGTSLEYVRIREVDPGTGTLTVERAERATTAFRHAAGTPILYVPVDVREAVAARAAEQEALLDESQLSIPDDGALTSRTEKADRFREEWQRACARYSNVSTL